MKALLALTLLLAACSTSSHRLVDTTVSITNILGTSGGSGTIIASSPQASQVLTNAHVCAVVKNGGVVNTDDGQKHLVKTFKVSNQHDLCLITVAEDLHASVFLASEEPALLSESIVSGHPRLLPIVINTGQFSHRGKIMVMTGYRDCTPDEATNPATGLFCAIIGKLPVVRRFDARLVSNLIQPGSSGSGVFNHEGELSGVIFAGTGDFSYGFIVPYEYVANFLNTEIDTLPELSPDSNVNILGEQNPNAKRDLDIKFADACLKITSDLCSVLDIKDMIMRKGR